MKMHKRKIGIAGMGRIGSRCAFTTAIQGLARELVLNDIDLKKAESEASDLSDCSAFFPHPVNISAGGSQELADCDLVAITAGILTLRQDRLALLEDNKKIVKNIVSSIMDRGFQGIFIVITNPCDLLALYVEQISGLGRGKVFSTGTFLDTMRLKKELSFLCGLPASEFQAFVLGEHGASQVIPWSAVKVQGLLLDELAKKDPVYRFNRNQVAERVRNGAWTAVAGKGVAEYGIASCFAACVRAIFCDERRILPLGVKLQGEYGLENIYMGVPAILGARGVEKILEIPLTEKERAAFLQSYRILKENTVE